MSDCQTYILEKYAEWRKLQISGHDKPGNWSAQEFMCWLLGVDAEALLLMLNDIP